MFLNLLQSALLLTAAFAVVTFFRYCIDAFSKRIQGEHKASTHLLMGLFFSVLCSIILLPITLIAGQMAGLIAEFVLNA